MAGAVGDMLGEALAHAKELLDVANEDLTEDDPARFGVLVAAAPALRATLRVLRDQMG